MSGHTNVLNKHCYKGDLCAHFSMTRVSAASALKNVTATLTVDIVEGQNKELTQKTNRV